MKVKALFDGLEQYIYFTYESLLMSGLSIKESKQLVLKNMNKYINSFSELTEETNIQQQTDEQTLFNERNKT